MDRLIATNSVNSGAADVAPVTGTPQFATSGNPGTGIPATVLPAYAFNAIQEELIAVIAAAGIATNRTNNAQVLAAIRALAKQSMTLVDTGAANAYTAVNPTPLVAGTWVNGVVQQIVIAHTNTGASTYAPDGLGAIPIYGLGLQALQGNELPIGSTAIMMKATIAGVNSGNPICILMECAGGPQQGSSATASGHLMQFGQATGVVGTLRNGKMSVTAASASATFTADEIVVETALGGLQYKLSSYSKSINLATTGAGGMDTGTAPVSGFVALYAIYNPTTQTSNILACNAATLQGSVYGGANMPAGYTASALIGVWPTNGSSQFVVGYQIDRQVFTIGNQVLSTATQQASLTSLSIAAAVPLNARTVGLIYSLTSTSSGGLVGTLAATANGLAQRNIGITPISALNLGIPAMPLITAQTIFYSATVTVGTMALTIYVTDYTF